MEYLIQYVLFPYLVLNFGLTFVWPSYLVWKRTGIFPVTFSDQDTAHDYVGKVFKILLALLLVTGAVYAFFPAAITYILPFWYLESAWLSLTGWALLLLALVWVAVAQHQMANSWRIGIDEKNKTSLVTKGVFSISRNPIFLGMLTTLFGLFLVVPNAITLLVLVTGFVSIQIQVRLEEVFLLKTHGEAYENYCLKTRRWL